MTRRKVSGYKERGSVVSASAFANNHCIVHNCKYIYIIGWNCHETTFK